MSELTAARLLAAADRDARRLLGLTQRDGGFALAAGWADVLRAAAEVLAAIPSSPANDDGDRLHAGVTRMLTEVTAVKAPPGPHPHPSTTRIVDTWQQAAALMHPAGGQQPAGGDPARDAAADARRRVARTLATLAHVTGRELHAHTRHGQPTAASRDRVAAAPPPVSLPARWAQMARRHEHRALDYLAGNPAEPPDGPPAGTPDPARLHTAVAAWTALAIRRSADPQVSASDLHHIAHTQAAALNTAAALTGAASDRGELANGSGPHLLHRLGAAATGWAAVAEQWTWARTPDTPRAAPATTSAVAALFTAIDATARAGAAWASPSQVADRLTGVPIVPILRTITEGSQVLAEIYQHLPDELRSADRLRAPARTLAQISTATHATQSARAHPDADISPDSLTIAMGDIARNRLLPLTPTAREHMATAGTQLSDGAHRAHQALLAATPCAPRPAPPTTPRRPAPAHQHHPRGPAPGPGIPR